MERSEPQRTAGELEAWTPIGSDVDNAGLAQRTLGWRRPDRVRCAYTPAPRLPPGTCPHVSWRSSPGPVTACARVTWGGAGVPAVRRHPVLQDIDGPGC